MLVERDARVGRALLVLFAISGFAGLIYESIWTQYLGLFLGHAAHAQSFVLILFMGGMALGAWQVSRRSARIARPLAVYAAVELAIGVFGIAFDPLYHGATGFAYTHLFPIVGDGFGLEVTRYTVSILLIGPQCIALGATFPLMSAGYLRFESRAGGRVLAGLYFSNSVGAAFGALAATFLLLPAVGLPGTVMTGGLLSILVALAVWPLGKKTSPAVQEIAAAASERAMPWLIVAAAAITGGTSFVYEITWIRMLAMALGSTLHAFELMLAAFIGGIACGGLWLRRRADTWSDAVAAAGWAQVLMGIAALGSLFVYAQSFEWIAHLLRGLGQSPTGYTLYNVLTGSIAVAVMFPAAFFAGMTLPLLTLVLLRRGLGEQSIGRVYAANTLGAIVGVLLTVHVMMPLIGVRIALWLAALVDLVLGVVLLTRAQRVVRHRIAVAAAASIVVAVAAALFTRVDPLVLASSVYRKGVARLAEGSQMVFYGDGKTASVALYQTPRDDRWRSIATNGKVDASIVMSDTAQPSPDEYTMTLAAALPLASLHEPDNVAVIGFGSGMTVHTFLGSDRVGRLDVVEIEPFMVEAAQNFGARVSRAYSDPRAHVVIDDAKAFLAGASRKYDIIVSEPSNPWVSGVAALFSEEFYDFVPEHLGENGIFVQWLQLYEITPELVGSVLKAMLPHFEDVHAYLSNEGDMLILASPHKKLPALRDPIELDPRLAKDLQRVAVRGLGDLSTFSFLGKRSLTAVADMAASPANSDYFPILQLKAPMARFMKTSAVDLADLQRSSIPLLEVVSDYQPPSAESELNPVVTTVRRENPRRAAREYRQALLANEPVSGRFAQKNLVYRLDAMRGAVRDCERFSAGEWVEASVSIAGATIPYLSAEDLKGVWIEPAWVPECARQHAFVGRTLAVYAAVAARDWQRVAELGSAFLATRDAHGLGELESYLLRVTELAYLALGERTALADLERKYGAPLKDHRFERRFMLSMAGTRLREESEESVADDAGAAVTPKD